ncbi:argininosuccinate lyase [Sphaerisporangium sp. B11E5]|uniref:argininosuccinate lyase n=1 Tax=Sphaerisporangium sp. B11E5 TaxID=3153563 RepID=UPI00325EE283
MTDTTGGADTGRLTTPLDPALQRMLLEPHWERTAPWKAELERITRVDLAHVVMLAERGVVGRGEAAALLTAISGLRDQDFRPIEGRPAPRGLYLAYEGYLIGVLGEEVGGLLHTGRSRNDLNATCLRLGLREPLARLLRRLIRLELVLVNRARRYGATVMPAYTHHQPAVPVTYGHYLTGLAGALSREVDALLHAGEGLASSPLGAGAVGGTSIPVDAARTAELLGFDAVVPNSIDAVAARDMVLRLLAAATTLGVVLSRAATDLLLWSSEEHGLIRLPDDLVGSSSMMPQKRNPFVLEHVRGKTSAALGAFVAAAAAMRNEPFTNSVAVGTEGTKPVWDALRESEEAVTILLKVFSGATVNAAAMERRAGESMITATAVAEEMVRRGVPFRRAHHEVGLAARLVLDGAAPSLADVLRDRGHFETPGDVPADPAKVCEAAEYGGGPGPRSRARAIAQVCGRVTAHRARLRAWTESWREAEARTTRAVHAVTGTPPA